MTASPATRLEITLSERDGATLVRPRGVLDLASYAELRDALLKCAVEQPRAILVDLDSLSVPTEATLAVFPTVCMRMSAWPGVPLVLIVPDAEDRARLRCRAVGRYVPVRASADGALDALDEPPRHRRTVLDLPCGPASATLARRFVGDACELWECFDVYADAVMIASELVENAVRHAHSPALLRLELRNQLLSIAVHDDDPRPPRLMEPDPRSSGHFGLGLVDRLATAWNSAPTWSGGKVVWAVLRCPPGDRTTGPRDGHAE
jgi:hypothetical protein